MREFKIYGDNVIECERLLFLIASSLSSDVKFIDGPVYTPKYLIKNKTSTLGVFRLLPGYNRYGTNIQDVLRENGAVLRELPDAILTQLDDKTEKIIFSIEFSSALPAGNNAWQRTGRALASVTAKVPYMYVADLGGIELGHKRELKAARYPNPLVPFAYITLGRNYGNLAFPVYLPSPSSTETFQKAFSDSFGFKEQKELVKALLLNSNSDAISNNLIERTLELVEKLSESRNRKDTLQGKEWREFLGQRNIEAKVKWLERKNMGWSKKIEEKVKSTKTFKDLFTSLIKFGALAIGTRSIPICLIPPSKRAKFAVEIKNIYGNTFGNEFYEWVSRKDTGLVVVLVTGFKPEGEDSRPDRGLVPLARMLLGQEINILTIVHGPARPTMWKLLIESPKKLAESNGLWESVLNLSNCILSDSTTLTKGPLVLFTESEPHKIGNLTFPAAQQATEFSEQDVDSTLHFVFSRNNLGTFESMCNPPGGDWSGFSFYDFNSVEYRWTSLPRVSETSGKRPDHVIEFKSGDNFLLLAIESKESVGDFEDAVGKRLNRYVKDLFKTQPNINRTIGKWWKPFASKGCFSHKCDYLSAGAYCWKNLAEHQKVFRRGKFDALLGFEFTKNKSEKIKVHITTKGGDALIGKVLSQLERVDFFEVKIH